MTDWQDFTAAVIRKRAFEIARTPSERLSPVDTGAPCDCQIGERMWQRNRGYPERP